MLFAFPRLKVALDLPDNEPLMYIVGDAVGELEGVAVSAGTGSPTEGRPDRDRHIDRLAQFDPVHGGLDADKTQDLCSSKGSVARLYTKFRRKDAREERAVPTGSEASARRPRDPPPQNG